MFDFERACTIDCGIDDFWSNTIRRNTILVERHHKEECLKWEKVRYLAFCQYDTAMTMSGKAFKIKNPTELFELDSDIKKEYKKDEGRALAAFEKYNKLSDAKI